MSECNFNRKMLNSGFTQVYMYGLTHDGTNRETVGDSSDLRKQLDKKNGGCDHVS